MDKDRIKGTAKQATGAVKEAVGKLVGDEKLAAEGKVDKAEGKVQSIYGDAKDKARDAVSDVKDKASEVKDKARDAVSGN